MIVMNGKLEGNGKIDIRPVLIKRHAWKPGARTRWGRRSQGANMFRCLVALFSHACVHACFGLRHERDIHNLHNRVTANRWGEDGSPVCVKATMFSLLA